MKLIGCYYDICIFTKIKFWSLYHPCTVGHRHIYTCIYLYVTCTIIYVTILPDVYTYNHTCMHLFLANSLVEKTWFELDLYSSSREKIISIINFFINKI